MDKNNKETPEINDYGDLSYLEKSESVVEIFLKKYGWDVEEAIRLQDSGVAVEQICKDYGISRTAYYNGKNKLELLKKESGITAQTEETAAPLPNALRKAEALGAGLSQAIQKGQELTNAWCLALEMPGAKMTTMEYVPIRNENIFWSKKIVKFGGQEFPIDQLVPDRKTQLVGLQALVKITGAQTYANELAKLEAKAFGKHQDKQNNDDDENRSTLTYGMVTKKEIPIADAEIIEPDVTEPTPEPKEKKDANESTKLF